MERRDFAALAAVLGENWCPARLRDLLASQNSAVTALAARCLGLSGEREDRALLAALLRHASERVSAAAEDGLWALWLRGGSVVGNQLLALAVSCQRDDQPAEALSVLSDLTAAEPEFGEAQHQLALALHSLGRYREAVAAYERALAAEPQHFAAAAGLGHAFVELGELERALDNYERALRIHPRMPDICEVVPSLRSALGRRSVA